MKQTWAKAVIAALAVVLSGCGGANDSLLAVAGAGLAKSVRRAGGGGQSTNPVPTLTRAMFDGATFPIISIEVDALGIGGTAAVIGQNGPYRTWAGADGAGVVLRHDVLTATRGLGEDLLAADVGGVLGALDTRGPVPVARVHRYLDGEGLELERRFVCTIAPQGTERIVVVGVAHATRVIGETCEGSGFKFENQYWIGVSDRSIWRSRQWVGPSVGSVSIQHIIR